MSIQRLHRAAVVAPLLLFAGAAHAQHKPLHARPAHATPARAAAADTDVVGSVNGVKITWQQVIARMRSDMPDALAQSVGQVMGAKIGDQLFGARPTASVTVTRAGALQALRAQPTPQVVNELNNMTREMALRQAAAAAHITVSEPMVVARKDALIQQARSQGIIPPNVTDVQFLASRHIAMSDLLNRVRIELLTDELVKKDLEQTMGRPISPSDFIQARHILLLIKQSTPAAPVLPGATPAPAPDTTAVADAATLKKAQQIVSDLRAGKITFEAAVKEYSEDPQSKQKGGDLGPSMRGTYLKEFDNVAFKLRPGEISDPVRTEYGYHIIQVEKLGKDLTQKQRDDTLQRYEQLHEISYLNELMTQKSKIVNNLRPAVRPGFGGMPMRPGAPGPPPGARPGPPPGAPPGAPPGGKP